MAIPPPSSSQLGLVHVAAGRLGLVAAAGLDRDPEITLLQLGVGEGAVRYGLLARSDLPANLHFNAALVEEALEVLVTKNSYCDR